MVNKLRRRRKSKNAGHFKFLPLEEGHEHREQILLWRGVLDQALVDYQNNITLVDPQEQTGTKTSVSSWLLKEEDFELVCDYANLDSTIVKAIFYGKKYS